MTVDERFDIKWKVDKQSGCHIWQAGKNPDGYGTFRGGNSRMAHRYAWERLNGLIPEGLVTDHICRNRACVNPEHMRIVTRRVNVLENSNAQAVFKKAQTHCVHGHEFTVENTYWYGPHRSYRKCRKCHARISLRHYHKKRQSLV